MHERYSCYKEFDNKKNSCSWKIPHPPPPPHNFSNGPSLNDPINPSWTRIHHRHPKLTLWVRYANLTFLQESRCRVLSDRWDFVWEIKYWGLRRPNIIVFTFCYKINKGDLTLMSSCVFLVWSHRFSRFFWLFLCDPCHSLHSTEESDRGHTI